MDHHTVSQWVGNAVSVAAIFGTLLGYVPMVAALVALVWYVIQISESTTAQRWIANRRQRKIARLRAKIYLLEEKARTPLLAMPPDEPDLLP